MINNFDKLPSKTKAYLTEKCIDGEYVKSYFNTCIYRDKHYNLINTIKNCIKFFGAEFIHKDMVYRQNITLPEVILEELFPYMFSEK